MAETILGFRIEVKGTEQQTAAMGRLQSETLRMRTEINKLNKAERDHQKGVKGSHPLTQKQIDQRQKLTAAISKNTQSYNKLAKQTGQTTSFTQKMGKSISGAALKMGLMVGGVSAVINVLKGAFKIMVDFEKANSTLEAVLGATSDEMVKLSENSKALGSTTAFTATQVAELQTEFAKLGFPTNDILNMTEATLAGAAALGSDLGEQAALTGALLNSFGLDATEAGRVNDVLAKSAASSALDFSKLSTALPIVGSVAKATGRTLEETTSILGVLTSNGLDASSSATSLRNIFVKLASKGLTMEQAMAKINGSTDKAKTSFELFGKTSVAAGVILAEQGGTVDELTIALENADGAAQEMADTMLDNLAGDITVAESAWEGFVLSLNDGSSVIGDAMRSVTQGFTKALTGLKNLDLIWKGTFSGLADFTQDELKRTMEGGWETEAGVNISKVVDAFDKIPFDKLKENSKEMQDTWTKILGEDSEDAQALFRGYVQERINKENELKKATKERGDVEDAANGVGDDGVGGGGATNKEIKAAEKLAADKLRIEEKRIADEKKLREKGIEDAAAFQSAKEAELFESERMQKINNIETEFQDKINAITGQSEREIELKKQLELLKREALAVQEEEWKIEDEEKALEERQLKLENDLLLAGEDLALKMQIWEQQKQAELSVKGLTEQQKRAIEINYEKQKDEARKAEKDRFVAKTQFEMGLAADAADNLSSLAKKGSEEQKALAVVSATIHGAQAVMGVLSSQYTGIGWIDVVLKAIAIAGVVAKTRQQIQTINSAKHEDGGLVAGASHAQGGVQMYHKSGEHLGEMEGNEYIISAKRTREIGVDRLDAMNFGGETAPANGFFQKGGAVPNVTSSRLSQATLDRQQNMEDLAATVSTQMQEAIVRTPVINNASETAQVAAEVTNSENSLRFG